MRNPWADGPEYITQCPIKPGGSYTYRFNIEEQEGTLWWHAHSRWLRATVYGALIIRPPLSSPHYPFPVLPKREFTLLLGEWWDRNPMDVLNMAQFTGAAPNVSDAFTINGQPGDFYRCSSQETLRFLVGSGETVLLRVINSGLNQELFFGVANHKLTVVAADASYTKPFSTNVIMLGPGQTTDVLLTADQPPAHYYMAAHAYNSANAPFDNTTTTAILEYKDAPCVTSQSQARAIPAQLPGFNDTATAAAFTAQMKSPSKVEVPLEVDEDLFFTVGLGLFNCPTPNTQRCQGPNGTRFTASINNVSFVFPKRNSIMQAYYQGTPAGVFTTDFPPVPPTTFDYTGNVSRGLWQPTRGTKAYKLKYKSKVQVILQDTSIVTIENHPMHLHGYEFYVVGTGIGNFNANKDTSSFNLIDPPRRNTIGTPPGGWIAIRFVADNPGVWLMHCHIDAHIFWGLAMVFLVENGEGHLQSVQSPPLDLPQC
ncbi:laccase-13 isoform X2 [Brassica napus]|nr:laccase-13 isoform X2 [Brassica napus]XP_048598486.1 laccase-13 isoform X2 [Brassica napus]XP_048598487.1 laccase-13 isoform X2 [Brassica napus]XP_048598488.1 laccase-13 isoform X2 [Brassica napus]